MVDPPPWPDRPPGAQNFDQFWLVNSLPPQPFPAEDYDYGSDPRFGPAGTRWRFPTERLIDRQTVVGTSAATKSAIEKLIQKLAIKLPPIGSMGWVTPLALAPPADPVGEPMRWLHATILATLGGNESVAHTLNFRTAPTPDVDQDPAAVQTFANQIRDNWVIFLAAVAGANTVQRYMSPDLVYKEVRVAYLEQTAGAGITTHVSRKTGRPVKDFAMPRPNYIVPTQFATFGATQAVGNSDGATLPYEVACCLSLKTAFRGPRNRGRFYLGGLTQTIMGANGNFQPTAVAGLAAAFDEKFLQPLNQTTGNDAHIVSRAYATSTPITGVSAGVVPDSQRRRRRTRLEAYSVASPVLLV